MFLDGTSLSATLQDPNNSASQLDGDLKKISDWTYKRKMILNPDLSKQTQEVIFPRKTAKISHASIPFNIVPVAGTPCQNCLGLYLDKIHVYMVI